MTRSPRPSKDSCFGGRCVLVAANQDGYAPAASARKLLEVLMTTTTGNLYGKARLKSLQAYNGIATRRLAFSSQRKRNRAVS